MDKAIRRVADPEALELETYRCWQSRPVGERLIAVCELSDAAYAFTASFKGVPAHDDEQLQGPPSQTERSRS